MVETLLDLLNVEKDYICENLDKNIVGLFLYGSFSYQDLTTKISDFSDSQDLFDKKPDFIAIVEDSYQAVASFCDVSQFDFMKISKINKILGNLATPLYLNDLTKNDYKLETRNQQDYFKLPYKIGFLEQEDFFSDIVSRPSVIYNYLRLSKPVNLLASFENSEENIYSKLDEIRNFIFEEAILALPSFFRGRELTYEYLNTYKFEKYRFFDSIRRGKDKKNKVDKIMDSNFFDVELNEFLPVRKVVGTYLSNIIKTKDYIVESEHSNNFCVKEFYSNASLVDPDGHFNEIGNTISCAKSSIKNAHSNSIFGKQSNMSYLSRKLGFNA